MWSLLVKPVFRSSAPILRPWGLVFHVISHDAFLIFSSLSPFSVIFMRCLSMCHHLSFLLLIMRHLSQQLEEEKEDTLRQLTHEKSARQLQEQINQEQLKFTQTLNEDLNKSDSKVTTQWLHGNHCWPGWRTVALVEKFSPRCEVLSWCHCRLSPSF